MAPKNEDVIPENYTYEWSANSDVPLADFLTKYKPSMVQNDGTKPWIWVRGVDSPAGMKGMEEAVKEASTLLDEVSKRVEDIKNDNSIPVRSSKKTGTKSKKEVREQIQAEATEKLKEISERHGYVNGKWLIFAAADRVDVIWSSIATSLASGPLKDTSAYCTKVSTSPENDTPNYQHVICVYVPNVYDKDAVTEVMNLLRNHGVNLSGVKSDLYTMIGLDSKHNSGIPSTVWKNTALLKDSEIKEMKEAFFSELSTKKVAASEAKAQDAAESSKAKAVAEPKKKVLKKKVQDDDDPFASDEGDEAPSKKPVSKKKPTSTKKRPQEDESEEEAKPKKGRRK